MYGRLDLAINNAVDGHAAGSSPTMASSCNSAPTTGHFALTNGLLPLLGERREPGGSRSLSGAQFFGRLPFDT